MHGGLFASDEVTLDDIAATERNRQPPENGWLNTSYQSYIHSLCFKPEHCMLFRKMHAKVKICLKSDYYVGCDSGFLLW